MKENKKENRIHFSDTPAVDAIDTQPENSYEMINKYGRCNIQPTATSGNKYPEIAQGLAKDSAGQKRNDRKTESKKQ